MALQLNKIGVYGGQVINGVLAKIRLINRPSESQNPSCGYFPSPRMYDWSRYT